MSTMYMMERAYINYSPTEFEMPDADGKKRDTIILFNHNQKRDSSSLLANDILQDVSFPFTGHGPDHSGQLSSGGRAGY